MPDSTDLLTYFVGKDHIHLHSVHSTNDYLKNLSREKEIAEGFTVSTNYQTSGRGQIGNTWEAEPGQNLLMSVFLRPRGLKASEYFFLNMSVCLALVEALHFFHPGFRIKWPNDILFDRKKVAGVLIENVISRNILSYSIIGVGVNVNQTDFSAKGLEKATSLSKITGRRIELDFLRSMFCKKLEIKYLDLQKGKADMSRRYFQYLHGYGEKVPVEIAGNRQTAEIENVRPDGSLLVKTAGEIHEFRFREIRFVL